MAGVYPAHREADVVLRDGSTVHVRPVRPDDAERLLALYRSLSDESRVLRFFSSAIDLAAQARRDVQVDYDRSYGVVATIGRDEQVVGYASYVALNDQVAEVAFAIADTYQGRGLGTLLLGHLAEVAAAHGIERFEAVVLPQNHRMLEVFRASGFPIEVHARPEELCVTFPTSLTPEALARFEQREQRAAAAALRRFFCPRAVAVIGASRRRDTVGGQLFYNLLRYGFNGPVYPVNPAAAVVQCVPAYPTIEAVPGEVDLAIIAVPAPRVVAVAEQCARKGVRALVVVSAGFSEVGPEGRERQQALLRVCRAAGMRLIGPNCIGLANTDPAVRLNAQFGPLEPPAGRVGFMSQSGALGLAAIDYAGVRGLGLSTFVSVGNKADISGNDLLGYWAEDPATDVILLYLESFGNPRKFGRLAREVGRRKPIVVVKSGRSRAGARASQSHTGALLAASDVPVDALFRQAGVIRTDTLQELFDVALVLTSQPPPRGRRVGIVTNVGGPAIMCADTCEAEGLSVPELAAETQAALRAFLPPEAAVANPVDMLAAAPAAHYRQALPLVARDPNIDAVIAIFLPPLATRAEDVARAMVEAAQELRGEKPLLAVFMQSLGVPAELRTDTLRIPAFAFPEPAAIALAHVARYGEWRARPAPSVPVLHGLDRDAAAAIVARALGRGPGWLLPDEVAAVLRCYGLRLAAQQTVATPAEAAAAARALGGPVALKAIAPGLVHKSELGAVRLDLAPEAVEAAAQEMAARLAAAGHAPEGFLVQEMVPRGVEMLVGVVHDPQFGPLVACGAGGVVVELVGDVSVRLAPLTREDAAAQVRELKSYPLLTGFRGAPPADVEALEDVLLRVSALAEDLPAIAELDCNPVMVLPRGQGAVIVDARIRVEPPEPAPPLGARRT